MGLTVDQMLQLGVLAAMLVAGVSGWFLRELWTAVKNLTDDLSKLKETLPVKYVQKDDYREDIGRILSTLDKIYIKLDNKLDR